MGQQSSVRSASFRAPRSNYTHGATSAQQYCNNHYLISKGNSKSATRGTSVDVPEQYRDCIDDGTTRMRRSRNMKRDDNRGAVEITVTGTRPPIPTRRIPATMTSTCASTSSSAESSTAVPPRMTPISASRSTRSVTARGKVSASHRRRELAPGKKLVQDSVSGHGATPVIHPRRSPRHARSDDYSLASSTVSLCDTDISNKNAYTCSNVGHTSDNDECEKMGRTFAGEPSSSRVVQLNKQRLKVSRRTNESDRKSTASRNQRESSNSSGSAGGAGGRRGNSDNSASISIINTRSLGCRTSRTGDNSRQVVTSQDGSSTVRIKRQSSIALSRSRSRRRVASTPSQSSRRMLTPGTQSGSRRLGCRRTLTASERRVDDVHTNTATSACTDEGVVASRQKKGNVAPHVNTPGRQPTGGRTPLRRRRQYGNSRFHQLQRFYKSDVQKVLLTGVRDYRIVKGLGAFLFSVVDCKPTSTLSVRRHHVNDRTASSALLYEGDVEDADRCGARPRGSVHDGIQADYWDTDCWDDPRSGTASVYIDDTKKEVLVAILKELRQFNKLRQIQLEFWQLDWSDEIIELLKGVFSASASTLQTVVMRCRMPGNVLEKVLEFLPPNLRSLDISENMLCLSVVECLRGVFRRCRLRCLKMNHTGLSPDSIRVFTRILQSTAADLSLRWFEGLDLSEHCDIPLSIFMIARAPTTPGSSSAAAIAAPSHLMSQKTAANSNTLNANIVGLGIQVRNYALIRFLRISAFLPFLINRRIRIWWTPTSDRQKTDFSGRYWPCVVLNVCTTTFVLRVRYDNGEEDFVSAYFVQPLHPLNYGGGWTGVEGSLEQGQGQQEQVQATQQLRNCQGLSSDDPRMRSNNNGVDSGGNSIKNNSGRRISRNTESSEDANLTVRTDVAFVRRSRGRPRLHDKTASPSSSSNITVDKRPNISSSGRIRPSVNDGLFREAVRRTYRQKFVEDESTAPNAKATKTKQALEGHRRRGKTPIDIHCSSSDKESGDESTKSMNIKDNGRSSDVTQNSESDSSDVSGRTPSVEELAEHFPYLFERSLLTYTLTCHKHSSLHATNRISSPCGRGRGNSSSNSDATPTQSTSSAPPTPKNYRGEKERAATVEMRCKKSSTANIVKRVGADHPTSSTNIQNILDVEDGADTLYDIDVKGEDDGGASSRAKLCLSEVPLPLIGNVLLPGEFCEFRDEDEHRGTDPSDFIGLVVAVHSHEPLYSVRCIYQDDDQVLCISSHNIRRAVVTVLDSWVDWQLSVNQTKTRVLTNAGDSSIEILPPFPAYRLLPIAHHSRWTLPAAHKNPMEYKLLSEEDFALQWIEKQEDALHSSLHDNSPENLLYVDDLSSSPTIAASASDEKAHAISPQTSVSSNIYEYKARNLDTKHTENNSLAANRGQLWKACVHPRIRLFKGVQFLELLSRRCLISQIMALRDEVLSLKTKKQRDSGLMAECQKLRIQLDEIQEKQQEQAGRLLCIICVDKERRVLLMPCRHFYLCVSCSDPLHICPMCRSKINYKVTVRREDDDDIGA